MDLELKDHITVVTGASKGIGLAVARTLLDEGARVVAVSRTTGLDLDGLAGDRLTHVAVDLMDANAADRVVRHAVDTFGGLDSLVNAAGGPPPGVVMPRTSFMDASDAEWRAMFELNLFAAVSLVRTALPVMLRRGGGTIVNVSSTHARQPFPNVDYSAAKAGLSNLTKALSEEYAPQGIRVNTVSPGPVRTPWWTDEGGVADILAERFGIDRDQVLDAAVPEAMGLSTGRLAVPQEVADQVALLVSPRSASTTGADIVVDSGLLKAV
ncbi:MAG TPA: SDR family NAD(P)-dependent oxidoreductase [Nocardioidaceae bacterium]|nr:SDR family NAD(P)-dependent oxidoreductase [Nocardioidaceae bacterium]